MKSPLLPFITFAVLLSPNTETAEVATYNVDLSGIAPTRRVALAVAVAAVTVLVAGCASTGIEISDEMAERIMSRSRVEYVGTPQDDGTIIIRQRGGHR